MNINGAKLDYWMASGPELVVLPLLEWKLQLAHYRVELDHQRIRALTTTYGPAFIVELDGGHVVRYEPYPKACGFEVRRGND